jgi:hypothetical protein
MKVAVIAMGLALLSLASPAQASWAENANMAYPVFTGTNAALARANRGAYYAYAPRRVHRHAWRKHYRRY